MCHYTSLNKNFDGGDLSSDASLLLIKEFACKPDSVELLKAEFKINDSADFHYHKEDENRIILQGLYFHE